MPLFSILLTLSAAGSPADLSPLYPELGRFAQARIEELSEIPEARRKALTKLARWIRTQLDAKKPPRLVFICTHNSRRSHIAEIWARTAAEVYGVDDVETFSGGTEATAFNPRAVAAMRRAGFEIEAGTEGPNPRYSVRFGPRLAPATAFSKVYSDAPNPQSGFAAIMTCSHADESCPLVAGAVSRISVPYEDPKAFDDTPTEMASYDERVRQISREMLFVFSRVD